MSAPPKVVDGRKPEPSKPATRLRYLQFESPIAGHSYAYSPGDIVAYEVPPVEGNEPAKNTFQVSDDEVDRLIIAGIADEVTEEHAKKVAALAGRVGPRRHRVPHKREPEAAVKEAPENAMGRKPAPVKTSADDWPT